MRRRNSDDGYQILRVMRMLQRQRDRLKLLTWVASCSCRWWTNTSSQEGNPRFPREQKWREKN